MNLPLDVDMDCGGFAPVPKDPSGASKPVSKSKSKSKPLAKSKAKAKVKATAKVKGGPKTKKSIPKKSVKKNAKGKGSKAESSKKHSDTDYGKAKKLFTKTFLWSNYSTVFHTSLLPSS